MCQVGKSIVQPVSSGPEVELVTAVISDFSSHSSLLKEADVLSTVVEHTFHHCGAV